MSRSRSLIILAGVLLLLSAAPGAAQEAVDAPQLVERATVPGGFNGDMSYTGGPNVCRQCHPAAYTDWVAHGHSRKLATEFNLGSAIDDVTPGDRGFTSNAREGGFALPTHDPDVYNWDNVLMIIGASKKWKTRFVGLDGYILTTGGKNQYNWETGEWVDYHADEVRPFTCGTCHTTGYDPDGTTFAATSPGIVGDWAHLNITCEACHGPGADHAAAPSSDNIVVDTSSEQCGTCHTRGDDPSVILAKGDFIRHHEQWPEQLASPHFFLDCTDCHDAHVGRYEGVTMTCEDCHDDEAEDYATSSMYAAKVSCEDCHMGFASKSAFARGPYEGDVWTHLFRIDSSADYDMFNRDMDGNSVSAKNAINLEFACFRCHAAADKAAFAAIGDDGAAYHTLGAPQ